MNTSGVDVLNCEDSSPEPPPPPPVSGGGPPVAPFSSPITGGDGARAAGPGFDQPQMQPPEMQQQQPLPPDASVPLAYPQFNNTGYAEGEPVVGVPIGNAGPYAFPTPHTQEEERQQREASKQAISDIASVLVFIGGCFCPLIWCAGIFFLRSSSKLARNFGAGSLIYLCCLIVLIILVVAVNVSTKETCNDIAEHNAKDCLNAADCSYCLVNGLCVPNTSTSCSSKSRDLASICRRVSVLRCESTQGCSFCFTTGRCESSC